MHPNPTLHWPRNNVNIHGYSKVITEDKAVNSFTCSSDCNRYPRIYFGYWVFQEKKPWADKAWRALRCWHRTGWICIFGKVSSGLCSHLAGGIPAPECSQSCCRLGWESCRIPGSSQRWGHRHSSPCCGTGGMGLREGGTPTRHHPTENSSLSSQCHTEPLETALSVGLFGMRFYSKILAGFNYPFSLHWRICCSFNTRAENICFLPITEQMQTPFSLKREEDHNPSSCKEFLGGFSPRAAPIRQTQVH